jgi:3-phosphoshikimate 1-carboxyvinyltransferase
MQSPAFGCPMNLLVCIKEFIRDAAGVNCLNSWCVTEFTSEGVLIKPGKARCEELVYDFVNEPDLAQTFVVTSVLLDIPFRFTGLQSLKIKETDRIAALMTELRKLGYVLRETAGRELQWKGERCVAELEPLIATYEDHRMAMAFAPAALKINAGIHLEKQMLYRN